MTDTAAASDLPDSRPAGHGQHQASLAKLTLGAMAVVFGDIEECELVIAHLRVPELV